MLSMLERYEIDIPLTKAPTGATVVLEDNYFKVTALPEVPMSAQGLVKNKEDLTEILRPVVEAIEDEGFEYALLDYSQWDDIKDSKFQALLNEIRVAVHRIDKACDTFETFNSTRLEEGIMLACERYPIPAIDTNITGHLYKLFVEMEDYLKEHGLYRSF